MPWRCPACGTPIRQQLIAAGDDVPRPGSIYHCGVCHLELVLNTNEDKLTIALTTDTADDRAPTKRRTS